MAGWRGFLIREMESIEFLSIRNILHLPKHFRYLTQSINTQIPCRNNFQDDQNESKPQIDLTMDTNTPYLDHQRNYLELCME